MSYENFLVVKTINYWCNLWSDSSALMFPTIDDHKLYDVKLATADIKAIQKLYGPRTKNTTITKLTSLSPGEYKIWDISGGKGDQNFVVFAWIQWKLFVFSKKLISQFVNRIWYPQPCHRWNIENIKLFKTAGTTVIFNF